jgi:phosphopantetheinyl transferase
MALSAGLAAGGFYAADEEPRAFSLSHSGGAGAALLSREKLCLGVDVIPGSRVLPRHAAAVLSDGERAALGDLWHKAPALIWALKEAAAKATGEPGRFFPTGLRINRAGERSLSIETLEHKPRRFLSNWILSGPFLVAWVTGTC